MNEQQIQQILTIQQAIAAAATAAVINSLLNPHQAATNALQNDPTSNDLQQQLQQQLMLAQQQQQLQQQQQQPDSRQSPATSSPVTNQAPGGLDLGNPRIQDLLMQLQHQASVNNNIGNPGALNLNLGAQQQQSAMAAAAALLGGGGMLGGSPSPIGGQHAQDLGTSATISNPAHSLDNQVVSPNKKLKTRHQHQTNTPQPQIQPHHHQQQHQQHGSARSSEATSKPLHSTPKNHSSLASLSRATNNIGANSSSSSAFLPNNVGLPRKLVRGQDVWLGRGAEQTRQILKCMWCGQSFRTLVELTQHMKITQHYTNIISQEQITSWRQPDGSEVANNKSQGKSSSHSSSSAAMRPASAQAHGLDDDFSEKFNDSDDNFSNNGEPNNEMPSVGKTSGNKSVSKSERNIKETEQATKSSNNISKITTSPKPLTRSRRRESDPPSSNKVTATEDGDGRENSPASPSSQRNSNSSNSSSSSSNNLILSNLNENSETNAKSERIMTNGSSSTPTSPIADKVDSESDTEIKEDESAAKLTDDGDETEDKDGQMKTTKKMKSGKNKKIAQSTTTKLVNDCSSIDRVDGEGDNEDSELDTKKPRTPLADADDDVDDENKEQKQEESESRDKIEEAGEDIGDGRTSVSNAIDDDQGDENDEHDNDQGVLDGQRSETNDTSDMLMPTNDIMPNNGKSGKPNSGGQKGEIGDPLSALETMVEKSFDPRMRPGVASGGILQRLGIDEEVCPPWQHINYANWYAAAAYGHPMAAALLAAGMNFPNGIKLNKNLTPKKSDD